MGSKLSIDKHVSNIEDILEMNPAYFSKLKIENNIPDNITQHIKIWRYFEEDKLSRNLKSSPVSLKDIIDSNFSFVSNECYLVLFVYKKQAEDTASFVNFPHSMLGVVESYPNLTPRGLEAPVASSESVSNLNKEVLESFLLPKKPNKQDDGKFEYMIFVWNGKTAGSLMKAMTLSAALQLDSLINKAKESLLQVLFSGGYIRNKKLWIGKILQLDSSVPKEANFDAEKKLDPMKDSIYLFKFLFPKVEGRSFKANGFKERFLKTKPEVQPVEDEYIVLGDDDEPSYKPEYTEEMSPMNSPVSLLKMDSENIDDLSLENTYRGETYRGDVPPLFSKNPQGIDFIQKAMDQNSKPKMVIPNWNKMGPADQAMKKDVPMTPQSFEDSKSNYLDSNEEDVQILSIDDTPPDSQDGTRFANNNVKKPAPKGLPTIPIRPIGNLAPAPETSKQVKDSDNKDANAKESDIKRAIKEKYFDQCNEVVEDFLYVAGEIVAYNNKKLTEYGITHIVNAAGDACESRFADKIKYLTLYLKDSRNENIECIFYEVIAFIENARQEGGKVLVHCVQGISRSVSLCMSYIIRVKGFTFQEAYDHLKSVREIASPNPAFWAQLYNFQMRLYGPFDSIASPRVFCVGSFQIESPQVLVARLLFETSNLFNAKSYKTLDTRGVFILQSQDKLFIWVGSEICAANKDRYIEKAETYIKTLQQYEHAPQEHAIINQGEEPAEFWSLWPTEPKTRYGKNKEWDHWFVDLATHKNVEGTTIHKDLEEYKPPTVYLRPGLYCYPELEPLNGIHLEELVDDNLLVLCTQKGEEKIAYIWRGSNVKPEVDDKAYLANVLRQRWPDTDPANIKIIEETLQESDVFMDYFQ